MDEVKLFSVMCSSRTRSNSLKLEHRKVCKNMRKNFFRVRFTEHWSSLPREIVESPSMEIFNAHLKAYSWDILQGICFSRGV